MAENAIAETVSSAERRLKLELLSKEAATWPAMATQPSTAAVRFV